MLLIPSRQLSKNTVKCAQSKSLSAGNMHLFPGSGMCSVNTGPACCHMPRASESIFLSGLGRVWLRGKALGKYRLDGEYTLLWLKERYPSHTQELDPCPSSSCAPALGGPQKYPPDPPWAALALHPHCVSG